MRTAVVKKTYKIDEGETLKMKLSGQQELFKFQNEDDRSNWFHAYLEKLNIDDEIPGWPDIFGDEIKKWRTKNLTKKIKVLSIFSGGGGLDIGFHDAGFEILESVEIEKAFAKTLEINSSNDGRLSGVKVVCEDINNYHPDLKEIDFIIGGPPCQTFSAAGARAAGVNGTDDDRGNLFIQYARLLRTLQPKGFLFENVYRIIGAQSGKAWKKIQEAFEELGYKLYWRILDAADYGVPQFRERLIIVGLQKGQFLFPQPSHGPDSFGNGRYYTAKEAISDLGYSGEIKTLGGRHGHLLHGIPPGLNYSFYTERMGHPSPIFAWRSKFSDYLYKAEPDTPVRTIKAQGGQYTGPFSWENRPFTCEELKRLQTFPDDYQIHGNRQKIIHQLGNSVPPQFSRILALSILDQVFHEPSPAKIDYMDESTKLGFRSRKSELTEKYAEKARSAIDGIKKPDNKIWPVITREYFIVEDNLQLVEKTKRGGNAYTAEYELHEDTCKLYVSDSIASGVMYKISIQPPHKKEGRFIDALLTTSVEDLKGLLATWKIFELLLKKFYLKDDLVQFFGYYQYRLEYKIIMEVIDGKKRATKLWDFITAITNGLFVGAIVDEEKLLEEFGCSSKELTGFLEKLKENGFEIRNHNTNKQISKGQLLIPYSFPTLNERSLQRLTRL